MTDLYLITKGFSWLERLIVVQEVAGSNPVFHPKLSPRLVGGFFVVLTDALIDFIKTLKK